MKAILSIFTVAALIAISAAETTRKESPSATLDQNVKELMEKLDSDYFQQMSSYLESDEFTQVLTNEKEVALKTGQDPDFFAAGFIRGISSYCSKEVLLKGSDAHRQHLLRSQWNRKNAEDAGFVRGCHLGKINGEVIFDRLNKEMQRKFAVNSEAFFGSPSSSPEKNPTDSNKK